VKQIPQLIFAPALFFASVANAASSDAVIAGGIDIAFKTLDLKPGNSELKTSMTSVNPNLAFGYGRFYVSAAYDKTLTSEPRTEVQQGTNYATTDQLSRSDIVLTVGVRVFDFLSVFAGWLQGDSNFNLTGVRNYSPGGPAYTIIEGNYLEKGPFAGLAFSHSFGNKGSLAATIGYAILDGEISQTNYAQFTAIPPVITSNSDDGQVKGLSYSLIWTGPLSGSLNYRVGVKYTHYNGEEIFQTDGGIEEKYTSFFLGITNFF